MKKLLLGTVGLLALSGSAMAADLPARTYKAPPPIIAPIYDWTGFYIGANGGWAESRNCWGVVPVGGVVIGDGCADRSGGVVGGQVGYRWQASQFVFGLEAQGDWADLTGSRVSTINPAFAIGTRTNGIGLFTGQIGYAWNATLLYLKGGAAVTDNSAFINTFPGGVGVVSASSTRWGGTVGVGLEYGFSPNWTAGIEYDHLFMGDANNTFSVVNPLLAGAANRISQDVDMVTARISFKFGGYGVPVAARY
jgi:outer membrane immunogenic protein